MWTRHSRVIWLFLTKQHSQTQEFLLGLFSHHSSETGVGGLGETGRETEWERERSGAMREETFLWHEAKYNYQRDMLLLRLHTSVRLKKKKKEAIYGWWKGSWDLLERKVHDLLRNVLCTEFTGLSGTWSALTWLAVSLRLRRLIGCGTFQSLTHSNLHSHRCHPIKLYMTAKDSWNVLNFFCNIRSEHSTLRTASVWLKKKTWRLW